MHIDKVSQSKMLIIVDKIQVIDDHLANKKARINVNAVRALSYSKRQLLTLIDSYKFAVFWSRVIGRWSNNFAIFSLLNHMSTPTGNT